MHWNTYAWLACNNSAIARLKYVEVSPALVYVEVVCTGDVCVCVFDYVCVFFCLHNE